MSHTWTISLMKVYRKTIKHKTIPFNNVNWTFWKHLHILTKTDWKFRLIGITAVVETEQFFLCVPCEDNKLLLYKSYLDPRGPKSGPGGPIDQCISRIQGHRGHCNVNASCFFNSFAMYSTLKINKL